MTDGGRLSADDRWQTIGGQAAVAAATILIGRWTTGVSFGFAIFLLVWLPVLAVWIAEVRPYRQRILSTAAAGLVTIAALLSGWPLTVAFALAGLLAVFAATVVSGALLLSSLFGRPIATAVAIFLWLTWLTVPVLLTRGLMTVLPEPMVSWMLSVYPLIVCNLVDSTAGDWTHQAAAYASLTRLGQDVAFNWPTGIWRSVGVHLTVVGVALLRWTIVPRGTMRKA